MLWLELGSNCSRCYVKRVSLTLLFMHATCKAVFPFESMLAIVFGFLSTINFIILQCHPVFNVAGFTKPTVHHKHCIRDLLLPDFIFFGRHMKGGLSLNVGLSLDI